MGVYSIMNVKQCNANYPHKDHLIKKCPNRGDTIHLKYDFESTTLYASCHTDLKPMCLIHTAGTSLPGEPRFRHFAVFDKEVGRTYRNVYKLEHPDVHSKYRAHFSAVDRFNNLALGSNSSVQYAVATYRW